MVLEERKDFDSKVLQEGIKQYMSKSERFSVRMSHALGKEACNKGDDSVERKLFEDEGNINLGIVISFILIDNRNPIRKNPRSAI